MHGQVSTLTFTINVIKYFVDVKGGCLTHSVEKNRAHAQTRAMCAERGVTMIIFGLEIVLALIVFFLVLRKVITTLGKEHRYFTNLPPSSVGFGSLAGGDVDFFVGSLTGENAHIDRETGIIYIKEERKSFWKRFFGVEFIGLGEMLQFEVEDTDEEGNITRKKSFHMNFVEEISILAKSNETKGGIYPVDFKLKITTRLRNAAIVLRYKDGWKSYVITQVKAAVREFANSQTPEAIMVMKNERPNGTMRSDFMEQVLSLNSDKTGNISLPEMVGQEILTISIEDINPSQTKMRASMEAKEDAKRAGEAAIEAAQQALNVAKLEAKRKEKLAEGDAAAITKKMKALKGNLTALVGLEQADAMRTLKDFKGETLAINSPIVPMASSKKTGKGKP